MSKRHADNNNTNIASAIMHSEPQHCCEQRRTVMIVKVAPMGEQVVEVNVELNSTVCQILEVAEVDHNDRAITVNNTPAQLSTQVSTEGAVISLANKMKGGRNTR